MQSWMLILMERRIVFKICSHSPSLLLQKGGGPVNSLKLFKHRRCAVNSDGLYCKSTAIRKTALVMLQLHRFNFTIWDFKNMYFNHTVEVWSICHWPEKNKLTVKMSTMGRKIIPVWFAITSSFLSTAFGIKESTNVEQNQNKSGSNV